MCISLVRTRLSYLTMLIDECTLHRKLSVVVVVLIAVVAYLRLYGYESMVPRAVHDAFDSNRL